MRIGITFDVKDAVSAGGTNVLPRTDDAYEEFDSPATIEAIAGAIKSLGHEVVLLGDGEPMLRKLLDKTQPRPDLVFNIAEGVGVGRCREARVPAVLEMLGIPYTGSDPLTLAVTLDKDAAKRVVADAGVPVPRGVRVDTTAADYAEELAALPMPVILKPCYEGSSKGIRDASLIHDRARVAPAIDQIRHDYRQPVLVEEFIHGDEVTVGLVGHPLRVIGAMRILPQGAPGKSEPFVYSLEVKRDWEQRVRYESPAKYPKQVTEAIHAAALDACRALGCRDISRVDFRVRDGVPYFLEVNPLPGLSPVYSDLIILGKGVNVSHHDLIRRTIEAAIARQGEARDA